MRRKTKVIKIGKVKIGGHNPIAIQSMVKTKTQNIQDVIRQINHLRDAGCDIVRLAVKDFEDASSIKRIKQNTDAPLVADIHFNWRLGIEAIKNGADKIRLNPGNISKPDEVKEIVKCAKDYGIAIRVGVNSGSVLKSKPDTQSSMVKSALDYIKRLEDLHFFEIVVSLKASDCLQTIEANRRMSKLCDYPIHLGVTATGAAESGLVKSSIGIGVLLSEGIGDTIRVSLTAGPLAEVEAAKKILETLNLRHFGPEIISCPTCGRCEVNLIKMVREFERKLETIYSPLSTNNRRPFKVALMGCVVNGPGEAKDADIGVAFGSQVGLLFKKGKVIKKVRDKETISVLLKELEALK